MRLSDYLILLKRPLDQMTISFLVNRDQVLLARKISKGGLGEGRILGFGGKVENGETTEDGARREILEEIHVKVNQLQDMGKVCFYFPNKGWNFEVRIYRVATWEGQPQNSNEMEPAWFSQSKIPYSKMWDDNQYWLPFVLAEKRIEAHFLYGNDNKTVVEFLVRLLDHSE